MKLETTTQLDAAPQDVFDRISDPTMFSALSDKIEVAPTGPDAWLLKAEMNGAPVEAELARTTCAAPGQVVYEAAAQGLVITVSFDIAPRPEGSDLNVAVDFAGSSMKGKMLMQGLKMMAPKMQSGLERMVAKLAKAA